MPDTVLSKTQTSFYRRLFVAHLIAHDIATVPDIIEATGMPRRTAQDTITALAELDIVCRFEHDEGQRHNIGHYAIRDWGPINPQWVADNASRLQRALGYA
ncbi:winged helix-turn-helix domain-containing protein [Cobetia sp. L2A1]|uniref:winged helix-turn-helix domain-containing protein n=1 Tax=Cobetia sp. L2A1 TaxID=2686360 RepID=UPI00131E5DBE|nr:winged helix-turn-helix domain-containing protein [Cobetia sp. L2A1]